ncbi:BAF_collapsed_G0015550.mRNA.1.CDS.1 [Saccharomyces cerevisiae]|nr:BAF_HP2_G0015090.mRNA.1.CDS.1 [Saccharomyces cerevisiae]CAI6568433.1 BAF_HP1_G0015540.mRNA.1.CDS.1 [Saccharomyces cerevisiae]CAI6593762.1 BAF_HP2_G0015090.mRNA.1.CDS.1 [Saccharomyces cerevisiae]CAI7116563.1 BAF_collapsed_G0015550.mRNA.1.CDS.1 [Saccharomyces cerevisiae]
MSATLLKQPLCTVVRQGKQPKVSGLNLLRLKAHLHRQHLSPSLIKLHSELKLDELQTDNTPDYVRLVLRSSVYDVINESPISQGVGLSSRLNTNVILKREDLLPVFSFKLRGAYNMIAKLDDSQRNQGVIACSAGNHAQGVAFAAKHLKIPATIVMPVCTPSIKYQNVSRLGSQVVLYGNDFDEAKAECAKLAEERGLTNIPPFDHPYVIAGQGTVAMEILRQVRTANKIGAVFVPVGGGGLIAGIGAYLKRVAPHIKIIGVETYDAATLHNSLQRNQRTPLPVVGTFADGTSVRMIGEETFRVAQQVVDEVVLVNTDEICAAVKDIFEDTRSIVEPSGALSVAGMKKYISTVHPEIDHTKNTYVPILSGANMNFDRLRFVSERAVLGEGKEVFMLVTLPDVPGAFKKMQKIIHPRSVTEFSYRYNEHRHESSSEVPKAYIYTSFSVVDREKEIKQVMQQLNALGFEAVDISDNELAKSHGRYLVGGASKVPNERIISFEFPERPGALTRFLGGLSDSWNLTLFHYRNHGADIGKVLAGISVPPRENLTFQKFLEDLGYTYHDETDNTVYQKFLKY